VVLVSSQQPQRGSSYKADHPVREGEDKSVVISRP